MNTSFAAHLQSGLPLVLAEVAQTHDGSLGQAHAFIDAAAHAGAHAIKFQTHLAAAESTPAEPWRVKFSRQDDTRYAYWQRMEFTETQWAGLHQHATERGLFFLSSPFSPEAVALLTRVGVAAWKVASGEVNNPPLFAAMAATGWPLLLSTGMSDWAEIDAAVAQVRAHGLPLAVLQCTSMYPTPPEKTGLNVIPQLHARYGCPVGLSDHSGQIYASLAAAALGAQIFEVHFTLSRAMFGPDVPVSLTPDELRQVVEGVRAIHTMRQHPVDKDVVAAELRPMRQLFNKSIVARTALAVGTVLTEAHLALKKPGTGLPAARLPELLGRTLQRALQADELLQMEDVL